MKARGGITRRRLAAVIGGAMGPSAGGAGQTQPQRIAIQPDHGCAGQRGQRQRVAADATAQVGDPDVAAPRKAPRPPQGDDLTAGLFERIGREEHGLRPAEFADRALPQPGQSQGCARHVRRQLAPQPCQQGERLRVAQVLCCQPRQHLAARRTEQEIEAVSRAHQAGIGIGGG